MTVELGGNTTDTRCTCPYDGAGECKHIVAVLLDVVADPPGDESDRVGSVFQDVPADDLREFVRDALAVRPDLRDRFLARFGDEGKPFEEYRAEIERLFDQHTQDYPVVTNAIDFSHFFNIAEQYRERDRYLEAATVYRGLFEGIDDNEVRIDAAYDHYAKSLVVLQSGLEFSSN